MDIGALNAVSKSKGKGGKNITCYKCGRPGHRAAIVAVEAKVMAREEELLRASAMDNVSVLGLSWIWPLW